MTRDEILRRTRDLRPWFQNICLGDGIWTKDLTDESNFFPGVDVPTPLWRMIEDFIPPRLTGMSALDVGCNAGFFSFELAKRGASVLGINIDQGTPASFIRQAEFCNQILKLEVQFRKENLLRNREEITDRVHEPAGVIV